MAGEVLQKSLSSSCASPYDGMGLRHDITRNEGCNRKLRPGPPARLRKGSGVRLIQCSLLYHLADPSKLPHGCFLGTDAGRPRVVRKGQREDWRWVFNDRLPSFKRGALRSFASLPRMSIITVRSYAAVIVYSDIQYVVNQSILPRCVNHLLCNNLSLLVSARLHCPRA